MDTERRKAALAAYKQRKVARGIYAMRCAQADAVWVGASRDLDKAENRLRFMMRHDRRLDPVLRAAYHAHGEKAFSFEVLERLDDDIATVSIGRILKEKHQDWLSRLNARKI